MNPFHSNSFLAFLLFICGLAGCGGDDCQVVDSYFYLDERAKEIFPYTGDETLHFLHILDGDTTALELVGKGRKRGFNKKPYIGPCDTPKEDIYEYYEYSYISKSPNESVKIRLSERESYPRAINAIIFYSENITAKLSYSSIEKDSLPREDYTRISKVTLNGNLYSDLIRVELRDDVVTDFTKNTVLYYQKEKGFIRLKNRTTGETYQLM